MANHNNEEDLSREVQTGSIGWLNIITVLVFIGLTIYMGYYFYAKFSLSREVSKLETDIQTVQGKIDNYKRQGIESYVLAQKMMDDIEEKEIAWSQAIKRLISEAPEGILFTSYSGTESGDLAVAALAPSFSYAANAIKVLADRGYFATVFSPALAKGINDKGQTLVSFGMKLKYVLEKKTPRD